MPEGRKARWTMRSSRIRGLALAGAASALLIVVGGASTSSIAGAQQDRQEDGAAPVRVVNEFEEAIPITTAGPVSVRLSEAPATVRVTAEQPLQVEIAGPPTAPVPVVEVPPGDSLQGFVEIAGIREEVLVQTAPGAEVWIDTIVVENQSDGAVKVEITEGEGKDGDCEARRILTRLLAPLRDTLNVVFGQPLVAEAGDADLCVSARTRSVDDSTPDVGLTFTGFVIQAP